MVRPARLSRIRTAAEGRLPKRFPQTLPSTNRRRCRRRRVRPSSGSCRRSRHRNHRLSVRIAGNQPEYSANSTQRHHRVRRLRYSSAGQRLRPARALGWRAVVQLLRVSCAESSCGAGPWTETSPTTKQFPRQHKERGKTGEAGRTSGCRAELKLGISRSAMSRARRTALPWAITGLVADMAARTFLNPGGQSAKCHARRTTSAAAGAKGPV